MDPNQKLLRLISYTSINIREQSVVSCNFNVHNKGHIPVNQSISMFSLRKLQRAVATAMGIWKGLELVLNIYVFTYMDNMVEFSSYSNEQTDIKKYRLNLMIIIPRQICCFSLKLNRENTCVSLAHV